MISGAPVKASPPGPSRKRTASATSLGSISRLSTCGARMTRSSTSSSGMPCAAAWPAICFSTSGVRTKAGQTAVAVTPCSAPSSASVLTSPSTPCLADT